MPSIFTKIIQKKVPAHIIYEDESHIAFLDINPMEKWHVLVVPKKEYETIFDMTENEYIQLQKIVLKVAKHLEKTLNCGINIFQNNREIAWQDVMHVHFHVIPRREKKDFLNFEAWDTYSEGEWDEYREKLLLAS